MKVSYPHMGSMSGPIRHMLEHLAIDVVEAPPITSRTLELGTLHSPEGACLPYKISLGNFIESLSVGADTLITMCGAGKCRLGFYGTLQKLALEEKRSVGFHMLNTESLLRDLFAFIVKAAPQASRVAVARSIALAVHKLKALDALNDAKNRYGPRADLPDLVINLAECGAGEIAACETFRDVSQTLSLIIDAINSRCRPGEASPPAVALVGEFYVLLEPYANHRLENALIRERIEIRKVVSSGGWAFAKTLLQTLGLFDEEKEYQRQARPYLNHHVGGDGLKSVGVALKSARSGCAGVVHLFPFGCMPEIVAQYALKNIGRDYDLPILSLSIDEHASDVGIATRIEAFADCIKRKNGH